MISPVKSNLVIKERKHWRKDLKLPLLSFSKWCLSQQTISFICTIYSQISFDLVVFLLSFSHYFSKAKDTRRMRMHSVLYLISQSEIQNVTVSSPLNNQIIISFFVWLCYFIIQKIMMIKPEDNFSRLLLWSGHTALPSHFRELNT